MRQKIEQKRDADALFDLSILTRAIQTAYERMWHQYLAGAEPQGFTVANG
jgi:predicted O-linked N-acetylglucosamine transferase (SPINDLY family)